MPSGELRLQARARRWISPATKLRCCKASSKLVSNDKLGRPPPRASVLKSRPSDCNSSAPKWHQFSRIRTKRDNQCSAAFGCCMLGEASLNQTRLPHLLHCHRHCSQKFPTAGSPGNRARVAPRVQSLVEGFGPSRAVLTTPASVNDTTLADDLIRRDVAACGRFGLRHHARRAQLKPEGKRPHRLSSNRHHPAPMLKR